MCFSATASFTAAAFLIPLGVLTTRLSLFNDLPGYGPMAVTPILFGLQQGLEGIVWLGVEAGAPPAYLHWVALAYLFFAYCFWLAWIPIVALSISQGTMEVGLAGRAWMRACLILGLLIGLWLWLPLAWHPEWIEPTVVQGSLGYHTSFLFLGWSNWDIGSFLYALVVTVPLMLVPSGKSRLMAGLIALSFTVAHWAYSYAFSSVWCYFAAILSSLILWMVVTAPGVAIEEKAKVEQA